MTQSDPTVRLTEFELPDFGVPNERPELHGEVYARRFDRFRQRLRDAGLTSAVVYADREHFANLSYLTGFDPRFEEALMVVAPGRDPVILTGPENQGTAKRSAIDVEVKLYPPFGLLGQERDRTPSLRRRSPQRRTGRWRESRSDWLEVFWQAGSPRAGSLDRNPLLHRRCDQIISRRRRTG